MIWNGSEASSTTLAMRFAQMVNGSDNVASESQVWKVDDRSCRSVP